MGGREEEEMPGGAGAEVGMQQAMCKIQCQERRLVDLDKITRGEKSLGGS